LHAYYYQRAVETKELRELEYKNLINKLYSYSHKQLTLTGDTLLDIRMIVGEERKKTGEMTAEDFTSLILKKGLKWCGVRKQFIPKDQECKLK
jgi:hypothetical protein